MMTREEMIEKFLCPGCVAGDDTKCGAYKPNPPGDAWGECKAHVLGTFIMPMVGNIALGMPKGFNRPGWCQLKERTHNQMMIRCWPAGSAPDWDWLNVPVWALERDGFLFVRTGTPRTGNWIVDVIEGGTVAMCPSAVNVTAKYEEYD